MALGPNPFQEQTGANKFHNIDSPKHPQV